MFARKYKGMPIIRHSFQGNKGYFRYDRLNIDYRLFEGGKYFERIVLKTLEKFASFERVKHFIWQKGNIPVACRTLDAPHWNYFLKV